MKKAIYIFAMISLFSLSFMPALAADTTVTTGVTRGTAGGNPPLVKVKWEMNGPKADLTGTDQGTAAGAQFMPSGVFGQSKKIAICGVVTDPEGLADVYNVYSDLFHPNGTAVGPTGDLDGFHGHEGCGNMIGTECKMTKVEKTAGIDLFCSKIRTNNNNLPAFSAGKSPAEWYADICSADGELQKEEAAVYCCDHELLYEDPSTLTTEASKYKAVVFALDKGGNNSNYMTNYFEYLPLTAFEVDFSGINYGSVQLATHKIISGDLTWTNPKGTNSATVRNVGNTRLQMSVNQNDLGLGKTGTDWNVRYDARIGNNASDWVNYWPETTTWIKDNLDLSEMDEMDFSIDISKFPQDYAGATNGIMTLGAKAISHYTVCTPQS